MELKNRTDMAPEILCAISHEDEFPREEVIHQQKREDGFKDIPHADPGEYIGFTAILDMGDGILDIFVFSFGAFFAGIFLMLDANVIYRDIDAFLRSRFDFYFFGRKRDLFLTGIIDCGNCFRDPVARFRILKCSYCRYVVGENYSLRWQTVIIESIHGEDIIRNIGKLPGNFSANTTNAVRKGTEFNGILSFSSQEPIQKDSGIPIARFGTDT